MASRGLHHVHNRRFGAVALQNGDVLFTKCTFVGNWGSSGGAVDSIGAYGTFKGKGTFINCTFESNSAMFDGGAVSGKGSEVFINCIFINNSSGRSGGAFDGGGTFINCTFMNNAAIRGFGNWGDGGAVSGNGTFTNCTLYGNRAKEKGGAFSGGGKIINSIFQKNTAAEKDNDITVAGNLEIDFSLLNYLSGAANYGANNIMGDPKFVDPANGDLRLRSDSAAIDKGKLLPELKDIKDLDGKPRVVGKGIDMGAYEWQRN